ncbi:restriction endonuclease subunit S [Paenibacillus oenotherae]|uniref:Restriction endonuclease subunit S n=1 Tax=Paenibacillus oenotherae TaxID=1435645 RepID=A0ABS7D3S9_9BACL|nr:restriction endonuclease subunit S [Paenibacillus oenotherae]MBW7474519.1 restriction endonuclease subunit S [Paenibacillus oenotherae]
MSREAAFARMLDASAKLQWNVAMILEAKAVEAEKVRNWLCNHVTKDAYPQHKESLKETLIIHEQVIEVIDGLTKLNQGMTNVMKAALYQDADNGGMGGMFNGGIEMGDNG